LRFLGLHRFVYRGRSPVSWKDLAGLCTVMLVLGVPCLWASGCAEAPSVLMDERTAETHLLAKKDPLLPTRVPALARVRKVVLLVTVDRQGVICDARPTAGPKALRSAAVITVKKHWRYRPFLVDWKPVVARFPVSVEFVLAKPEPRLTACRDGLAPAAGRAGAV
jgi:hypothetical protein